MAAIEEYEIRKGHCPDCGPDKMADVVKHFHETIEDDDTPVWLSIDYRILKCRGCTKVYFQTREVFSEDDHHHWYHPITGEVMYTEIDKIKHWPTAKKRKSVIDLEALRALDENLCSLYEEACCAFDQGLNVLAATGIRTTIDAGANLCGIDPADTFDKKLKQLQEKGYIGAKEKENLEIVVDAGSAAAHRGWRPEEKDLHNLFFALEIFLQHLKFPVQSLQKLKESIPERQRKQKPEQKNIL